MMLPEALCCSEHCRTGLSPTKKRSALQLGKEAKSKWKEESLHYNADQTSGEHLLQEATATLLCFLGAKPLALPLQLCRA